MAWLPYESEIAMSSEKLILKYNPEWSGKGMTRFEIDTPDWLGGLFEVANAVTFDVNLPFTRETWNGRMKACRGIGASSLTDEEKTEWEKEHLKYLETVPEKFDIPHYVSILDLEKNS